MRYIFAVVALASVAFAQDDEPTQLVTCATACVTKFTTGSDIAGCQQGNIECVCSNSSFLDEIACCLVDVCSEEDQKSAVKYARSLCAGAGVQVPDEVVCKANSTDTATGTTETSASTTETAAANTDTSAACGKAVPMVGLVSGAIAVMAML